MSDERNGTAQTLRNPDLTARERIRLRLPSAQREAFDALLAWEDEMLAFANEASRRADLYRQALIVCAELAGADAEAVEAARSGAQVVPTVEDFAINMVAQLRERTTTVADGCTRTALPGPFTLTERIFGLTLLGFSVEAVADYLGVPVERVKAERAKCREIAHGTIADVLSEWRG